MILPLLLLAAAEPADSVCVRQEPPPAGFEPWSHPVAGDREIEPGTAEELTLTDVSDLRFAAPPAQAPIGGTYGAVLDVRIAAPGTYRVALSTRASIDIARDGRTIDAASDAEGPVCSGIALIVSFTLQSGSYALQISGAAGPQATVLLAADPASGQAPAR